ncbi:energy transducer TonB [Rhodanobacter sp. C01]|uniref:energy transducer TonB n=1 Tax=Rhodanobacter sp. C01 TaxID=1945856 RepID=UPI0009845794|nr:energy transducer TonB [Rhodanobacter sp. C01]OOG50970.1 energy transducer TonB [Rhodanobacter sp. C01]
MSSASLAVAHRPRPDSARIAALSAAIALNLAVIMVATRPLAPVQLSVTHPLAPVQQVRFIDPPAKLPPPVELKSLPKPRVVPQTHLPPLPIVAHPVVIPSTDGDVAAPPVTAPTLAPTRSMPGTGAATEPSAEASLAYRSAPLQFPVQALRQHMQGTVLLRVLVDETGKPVDVQVEHGSGYALLDRSAREQVLASWRFHPAIVNGQAVRAWARVPVSFALQGQ